MVKSLVEVLEENGVQLTKSGVRYTAKCPFHGGGDRTPPFTVYPNDTYFCFACEVWGDAVKFLVDKVGMAPDAALDYVGADYKQHRNRQEVIKIKDKSKVWPFLYEVADLYHKNLLKTPGALMYLRGRGLSDETISKYKLGYTDGSILDIQNSLEFKMAVEYGVITDKGYERLSHRITIPNIPEPGACDFIIGRTVIQEKVRYLGINTPKTIYGLFDAWASPVIFIVEGHFDWLVLREWGFPSVVIGGTHIKAINSTILKERKVVIVPDNDAEGIKAATRLKATLGQNAMILDYASLGVKDVGEAATKDGARGEFIRLVREQVAWPLSTSSPILAKSFRQLSQLQLSH